MFDLRYILIITLLSLTVYLVYNLYSYQSNKVDQLKENINEKIDIEFEEINERLDEIEHLLDKKLSDSNKKIDDLYSLQNKMNEVYKMNGQTIINQINQYDEGFEEICDNKDQIFNSVENSSQNKDTEKKNDNCFIKISQLRQNTKEQFFISPDEPENKTTRTLNTENKKNETEDLSESSKLSSVSKQSETNQTISESIINSKNKKKNKKLNKDGDTSIVLEINDNFIKTPFNTSDTPKANNAYKSINDFSNLIKSNSTSKYNIDDNKKSLLQSNDSQVGDYLKNKTVYVDNENTDSSNSDIEIKDDTNSCDELVINNDPPLIHHELFNKLNLLNKSKLSNKIIDITT